MAGIGFQLERLTRERGLGGIASAAAHGAVVSCGPWMLTVAAVLMLQQWTGKHLSSSGHDLIHTIIIYGFSAAAVVSAPLSMIASRLASDLMFAGERKAIPGVLSTALMWGAASALLTGTFIFGFVARLRPEVMLFATAILVLLTQISISAPFLTLTKRHGPILIAYIAGVGSAALVILLSDPRQPAALLATVAAALSVSLVLLIAAIRCEFHNPPCWRENWVSDMRRMMHIGLAGLASALAAWIDKWMLWWWGADSIAPVGGLRLNPINDQASFLGLLMIIPGMTMMLIFAETRLDEAVRQLIGRCTGTAKLARIEEARRETARILLDDLRLLVVIQALLAFICWVLAPEIFRLLGMDARGIFGFRLTVIGVIFHVVAIYATIVLSYYDLFGRILACWLTFVVVSLGVTAASWNAGFASFGWGYLAGALAASSLALALLADATLQLTYLLFVGNNPAVVGKQRYWV